MTVASRFAGAYLYVCVNWFHVHYDEGFSSLRIPHFKGFSRLHITSQVRLSPDSAVFWMQQRVL